MEYARLGSTGMKVSRLCLGCMGFGDASRWVHKWVLTEENSRPIIQKALEMGINFFDTANVYSIGTSEEILGRALKDFARRDEVVIATKVHGKMNDGPNGGGLSRKAILSEIDHSLRRLETDYVDLYQIHRWDSETPIEETLDALDDVVRAGKARYIGASSMFAWQFAKALHVSDSRGLSRFVSMQNHYNLVYREEEREMIPLCRAEGIGLIPWSPMARGFLAGNRVAEGKQGESLYFQPDDFAVAERTRDVAAMRNVKPAQIALAWIASRPGVVAPIVGATKTGHLEEAIAALDIALDADEVKKLEEPYRPHAVLGI